MKNKRIKRLCKYISPFIKENCCILDIGCGSGELGDELIKEIEIKYYGVDILSITNKDKNIIKSDIPYPFTDKSFDIVILVFTLHHFEKPEEGLREAIRLSKNKIILVEDVPRNKIEHFLMKLVDYIGNRFISKDIPLPFNFYSDDKWSNIFKDYNLKLKNKVNVYPLPFPRLNHYLYELLI